MPLFLTRKKDNIVRRLKRNSLVAQIILVLLGIEILFLTSFTALSLPTATPRNVGCYFSEKLFKLYSRLPQKWQSRLAPELSARTGLLHTSPLQDSHKAIRYSLYVPQAPATIFLGYVLGWPLALITVCCYILLGLLGPIFRIYPLAAGTGLNYYWQPGFGYLLGMIIAACCVAYFSRGERTSLKQLISLFLGLLCVHGIGLTYLLGICLFGAVNDPVGSQLTWSTWVFQEVRNLSWYALPYDFIFSLALIGVGFPFRWLVSILIAPDIGLNNGQTKEENTVKFQAAVR